MFRFTRIWKNCIKGLGDKIKNVKYIISEYANRSFYSGDILLEEYRTFLTSLGFDLIEVNNYGDFGDALFKNNNF